MKKKLMKLQYNQIRTNDMFKNLFKKRVPEPNITWEQEREISILEGTYKVVSHACKCLRYDCNESLIEIIKDHGYNVRIDNTKNYYYDLKRIEKDNDEILEKVSKLKKQYYGK